MLSMYSNLAKQYVLSANHFHSLTLLFKFGISNVSSSTMNMFASTGPNVEPIVTPSTWHRPSSWERVSMNILIFINFL